MPSVHHQIEISVRGKDVVPSKIPKLNVGDTVTYSFKGGGKAIVTFPGMSPYRTDKKVNTKVASAEKLTVMQAGKFPSGCQVELPNGVIIGWSPKDLSGTADSGADHEVVKR